MRFRLVCAVAVLVFFLSIGSVSAGWVVSHDFGTGTIVTDMFVWQGNLYAMVHSYLGGGKAYFYRVTGVSGTSSTWELVWASDSPYAELEHALVWDGIPFYSVGKKVFYVSSGYSQPAASVDYEFSTYVSDIAVFKDHIYAVTVVGSLWRSAGYGQWSHVTDISGIGSFDWALEPVGDYLFVSCPSGIWRSSDGSSFSKVSSGNIRNVGSYKGYLWASALNGSVYNSSNGSSYNLVGHSVYPVTDFYSFGDVLYVAAGSVSGRIYTYSSSWVQNSSFSSGVWCLGSWSQNLYAGFGTPSSGNGSIRVVSAYSGMPVEFKYIDALPAGSTSEVISFACNTAVNYTIKYWKEFPPSSISSSSFSASRSVLLSGLSPASLYFYNVSVNTSDGRYAFSDTLSFNTSAPGYMFVPVSGSSIANFTDTYESAVTNDDLHSYNLSVTGDSNVYVSSARAHGGLNSTRFVDYNTGSSPDLARATRPLIGRVENGSIECWIYLDTSAPWPWKAGDDQGFWVELWEASSYPYDNPDRLLGRVRACWDGPGTYGFYNSSGSRLQSAVQSAWHNLTISWSALMDNFSLWINGTGYSSDWINSPVYGVTHVVFRMRGASVGEVDYDNLVYLDDFNFDAYAWASLPSSGSLDFHTIFSLRGDAYAALNNATNGSLYRYNGSNWSLVRVFPGPIGDCVYYPSAGKAFLITSNTTHGSGVAGAIWSASYPFDSWSLELDLSTFPQSNQGFYEGFELSGENDGARWWVTSGGANQMFDFDYNQSGSGGNQDPGVGECLKIDDWGAASYCQAQVQMADPFNSKYFQIWFKFDGSTSGFWSMTNFSLMNGSDFWVHAVYDGVAGANLYAYNGATDVFLANVNNGIWYNLTVYYNSGGGTYDVYLDESLVGNAISTTGLGFSSIMLGTCSGVYDGAALFDDFKQQQEPFNDPMSDCSYAVSIDVQDTLFGIADFDGLVAVFTGFPWDINWGRSNVFYYNYTLDEWYLVFSGDPITKLRAVDGEFWFGSSPGYYVPSSTNESHLMVTTVLEDSGRITGYSPSSVCQFSVNSYVADMVWTDYVYDNWLLLMNSTGPNASLYRNFTAILGPGGDPVFMHSLSGVNISTDYVGADRLAVAGTYIFVATGNALYRFDENLSDPYGSPVLVLNDTVNGIGAIEWFRGEVLVGKYGNSSYGIIESNWRCANQLFPFYASGNDASVEAVSSWDRWRACVVNVSTAGYPHDAHYFFDASGLGLNREYLSVDFVSHAGPGGDSTNVYLDSLVLWVEDPSAGILNFGMYVYGTVFTPMPIIVRATNNLNFSVDNSSVAYYYDVLPSATFAEPGWYTFTVNISRGSIEFPRHPGTAVSPSYYLYGDGDGLPVGLNLSCVDHRVTTIVHSTSESHFWFDARALGFYNYSNNYSWFRVDIPANNSERFDADKILLRVNDSGWFLDIWEGHSYLSRGLSTPHPTLASSVHTFNWSIWFDEDTNSLSSSKFGSSWFTTSSLEWESDNSSIPASWPGESANLTINLSGSVSGMDVNFSGNITSNCDTNDTNVSLDVYNATDNSWIANIANGTYNFSAGVLVNLTTLFGYPAGSVPNWTAPANGNYYANLSAWNGTPNLGLGYRTWSFNIGGGGAGGVNVSKPWIRDYEGGSFYTDDSLTGMMVAAKISSPVVVTTIQLGYRCKTLNDDRWTSVSLSWQGNGTYYYVFDVPAQLHRGDRVYVYAYAVDVTPTSVLQNASYVVDWVEDDIKSPYGDIAVFHEPAYSNGRFSSYVVSPVTALVTAGEGGWVASADFKQEGPPGYGRIKVVPPSGLPVLGVNYDGVFYSLRGGSISIGRAAFSYNGRYVLGTVPLSSHNVGVVFGSNTTMVVPPEWDVLPDGPVRFPFGHKVESTPERQAWQRAYVNFWVFFALIFGLLLLLLLVFLLWGLTCWLTIFGLVVLSIIAGLLIQIVPYAWLLLLLFVSSIFFVLTRKSCKKVVCKIRYDDSPAYRSCVERAKRSWWAVMPFFAQAAVQGAKMFYANYTYGIAGLLGAYGMVMLPFLGYNFFGWRTNMPI